VIAVFINMSNVAQRLQQYRRQQKGEQEEVTAQSVMEMTLEALSQEKIAFGKAHLGTPFPEMFLNHGYTDWFVGLYHESKKPAHMKYVRYVELRLNQEIATGETTSQGPYPKAKAAAASRQTQGPAPLKGINWNEQWDQVVPVDEIDEEFEMLPQVQMLQMEEQVSYMREENKNLNNRMSKMESSVEEILQHLRQMSIKKEP